MDDPIAFLSYVHSDDEHDKGRITGLRSRLEGEVKMHTGRRFQIFQDRNDLAWGQQWADRIDATLSEVTFLIPVITPSFMKSPACRKEYTTFLQREQSLGTNQLILPLYYLTTDEIENANTTDEIAISIRERQYSDWRGLRFSHIDSSEVARHLSDQALMVKARMKEVASIMLASRKPVSSEQLELSDNTTSVAVDKISTIEAALPTKPFIYRVYTREFDEHVTASDFLTGEETLHHVKTLNVTADTLRRRCRAEIERFLPLLAKYKGLSSASIILLLDNSGSLRGDPILYLSAWTMLLTELFENAGFHTDVTGFTTRAWKGGQSREKWLVDGRPPLPGRLNDIRYINYKAFDESFSTSLQNFSVMLREGLLKENVDGEALLFAKEKIEAVRTSKRVIVVFSDGAPVDDSTLSVNEPGYLEKHLSHAIGRVMDSNVDLLAIGIDHDVRKKYYENGAVATPQSIGSTLFDLMESVLF